jgi:hypothetical protein
VKIEKRLQKLAEELDGVERQLCKLFDPIKRLVIHLIVLALFLFGAYEAFHKIWEAEHRRLETRITETHSVPPRPSKDPDHRGTKVSKI